MNCKLLTPNYVASALNIKTGTLATWRSRGKGPIFVKLNGFGSVRYPEQDFEEYTQNLKAK